MKSCFYGTRQLAFAILMACSLIPVFPASAQPADDLEIEAQHAYVRARSALRKDDCAMGSQFAGRVVRDTNFATLSDAAKRPLAALIHACELTHGNARAALALLDPEKAQQLSGAVHWKIKLKVAITLGSAQEFVDILAAMQTHAPDVLMTLDEGCYFDIDDRLKRNGDMAGRRQFLSFVVSRDFGPGRYNPEFDQLRRNFARILVSEGNDKGALDQLRSLINVSSLPYTMLDPTLRPAFPQDFDVREALEDGLAHLTHLRAERPDILILAIAAAEAHRALGNPTAAIYTLNNASPLGNGLGRSADGGEMVNWWWDALAYAYQDMGKYEDAVSAMKHGIASGEDGGRNISQIINLAMLQEASRRATDALETLSRIGAGERKFTTPYARTLINLTRGCAALAAGKAEMAREAFQRFDEEAGDFPELQTRREVCVGDDDAASALLLKRLGNPDDAPLALYEVSDYLVPEGRPENRYLQAIHRLSERPDVKAAIASAGGRQTFRVISTRQ